MMLAEPLDLIRLIAVMQERHVRAAPDFLPVLFGNIEHRENLRKS